MRYCLYVTGVLTLILPTLSQRVLIVGGGVAGITAARHLLDNAADYGADLDVLVLEGSPERIGGRLWTYHPPGFPDQPVELGAMWLHEGMDVRQPIAAMCRRHNLPLRVHDFAAGSMDLFTLDKSVPIWRFNGSRLINSAWDIYQTELARLTQVHQERPSTTDRAIFKSLEKYAPNEYGALHRQPVLRELAYQIVEEEFGESKHRISTRMYDGLPDSVDDVPLQGDDLVVPTGYKQILDIMMKGEKYASKEVKVQLGQQVAGVSVNSTSQRQPITVRLVNNTEWRADYVVMAVPLGVLKAGDIQFQPPLARTQRKAVRRIGYGNFVKVLMVFDRVFWPTDRDWLFVLPHADMRRDLRILFVNAHAINGLPALLAVIVGPYAYRADRMTDEALFQKTLSIIRRSFPGYNATNGYNTTVPKLVHAKRTRWRLDSLFRGTYSYPKIGMRPEDGYNVRQTIDDRVFFAGEYTAYPEGHFATIHGAHMSGIRAANEVLRAHAKRTGRWSHESNQPLNCTTVPPPLMPLPSDMVTSAGTICLALKQNSAF